MKRLRVYLIFCVMAAMWLGAAPALAAPPDQPQSQGTIVHIVQPGDTVYGIALRYGTTVSAIVAANGLKNPSRIYVGQRLLIPRSAGGSVPVPSGGGKRIVISLSQQHLYAYEGTRLVYSFVCSSGRAPYYTRVGTFRVQSKIPRAWGSAWGFWMPSWLGIYWAGKTENGIHALPAWPSGRTLWAGYLGQPISYGCIVLGTYEAQLLYNWAQIGTPVSIQR